MKLSGNTVLITGGATGIGLAMAEAFLQAGSEVIICGRRQGRLLDAQNRHPALHVTTCDVANPLDCRLLAEWVSANFKNFNVLVNNAGVQRDIDLTKGVDAFLSGESEIRINLEGPIVLSGLFIPLLAGKNDPAIVNVSSALGFVPAARMPVYSATKAGYARLLDGAQVSTLAARDQGLRGCSARGRYGVEPGRPGRRGAISRLASPPRNSRPRSCRASQPTCSRLATE